MEAAWCMRKLQANKLCYETEAQILNIKYEKCLCQRPVIEIIFFWNVMLCCLIKKSATMWEEYGCFILNLLSLYCVLLPWSCRWHVSLKVGYPPAQLYGVTSQNTPNNSCLRPDIANRIWEFVSDCFLLGMVLIVMVMRLSTIDFNDSDPVPLL